MKPDGVRDKYGVGWVTEDHFFRLPFALKSLLNKDLFVVAHDPRPSSASLYEALLSGAKLAGVSIYAAGMMPTPMLAKWVHDHKCYGLMVTASHNPVSDNGIKFVGFSLDDQMLSKLSWLTQQSISYTTASSVQSVEVMVKDHYVNALRQLPKTRYRCLVDTANGAWHKHLDVLNILGLDTHVYSRQFMPHLINQTGCVAVKKQKYPEGYDYTIVLDGDGDRLLLVKDGIILDGDDLLNHLAIGESVVVGTELSNAGLQQALMERCIALYRVKVGDQNISHKLEQKGLRFGSEPCGHIIDKNWMGYSDPVYIVSQAFSKGSIVPVKKMYQRHINLPANSDIKDLYQKLSYIGIKTVIRRSNTEPVVRIMLEGDKLIVDAIVENYALNSSSI